jgi:hypothetical protein
MAVSSPQTPAYKLVTCAHNMKQMVQWCCKCVWGPYKNTLVTFQKQLLFLLLTRKVQRGVNAFTRALFPTLSWEGGFTELSREDANQ